jgi:acyl carrier protein
MNQPVTREEVLAVVKKHMASTIEDLRAEEIDPSRPMSDYGAASLDIVEVVSGAMRELKVKVPRTELAKLTDIDQLVTLLYRVAQEKVQPQEGQ